MLAGKRLGFLRSDGAPGELADIHTWLTLIVQSLSARLFIYSITCAIHALSDRTDVLRRSTNTTCIFTVQISFTIGVMINNDRTGKSTDELSHPTADDAVSIHHCAHPGTSWACMELIRGPTRPRTTNKIVRNKESELFCILSSVGSNIEPLQHQRDRI